VWEEREKMKFFLSPPKFWGVYGVKIFNFHPINTPCEVVTGGIRQGKGLNSEESSERRGLVAGKGHWMQFLISSFGRGPGIIFKFRG
jgi:hypothetical protein